jgi:hypothetical protein
MNAAGDVEKHVQQLHRARVLPPRSNRDDAVDALREGRPRGFNRRRIVGC